MPIDVPLGVAILNPSVAAAGTDLTSATQISALTSIVTNGTGGVKLLAAANYTQVIANISGQPVNVYPASKGMAISPNGAGSPVVLADGRAYGIIVAGPSQAYIVFNTSSFG